MSLKSRGFISRTGLILVTGTTSTLGTTCASNTPGKMLRIALERKSCQSLAKMEKMFSPGNSENNDINDIGGWRNHFYRRSEAVAFVMDPEFFFFRSFVAFCRILLTRFDTYLKTTWLGFLDSIA